MTPQKYKAEREKRGTQAQVATALDIQRETLSRRETGAQPITREAWLALLSLPHPDSPGVEAQLRRELELRTAERDGARKSSAYYMRKAEPAK